MLSSSLKFILIPCGVIGLSVVLACNPMKQLHKVLAQEGYIAFQTPLEKEGSTNSNTLVTGMLIAGMPKDMHIIAGGEECFPDQVNGMSTNFRELNRTELPKITKKISVSGGLKLKLLKLVSNGNGTIEAGVEFSKVSSMSLEIKDAYVERINKIKATQWYRSGMSSECKEYLNHAGFVSQALRVNELRFSFTDEKGGDLKISVNNIKAILDIGVNINYKIVNQTTLVITNPTYMGFQLGSLRVEDQGLSLYIASSIKKNKYYFKKIDVFSDLNSKSVASYKAEVLDLGLHESNYSDFNSIPTYLPEWKDITTYQK